MPLLISSIGRSVECYMLLSNTTCRELVLGSSQTLEEHLSLCFLLLLSNTSCRELVLGSPSFVRRIFKIIFPATGFLLLFRKIFTWHLYLFISQFR